MLHDLKTHEILDIFASGLTSDPPVDSGVIMSAAAFDRVRKLLIVNV